MHPDIQHCRRGLVAQTLEKYQYIFTHDLHLSHSCCSEGHLVEQSRLKCLPQNTDASFNKSVDKYLGYKRISHNFMGYKKH